MSETAEKHLFPCQKCGAQLSYKPGTELMECEHCGHQHNISVASRQIREADFHNALKKLGEQQPQIVSMTVKCKGCAAEFEFDANVHADDCPYCGSKIVSDSHQFRHIKPWGLLPFKVSAQQASEAYRRWLKKLWFAPNKLKIHARKNQQLNGMYVPYWTYDCFSNTSYVGERGTFYQEPIRVRIKLNGRWTTQTRMITKIRWQRVSGHVSHDFDDVLIFASHSLPRNMARELAPWDTVNLITYQSEFLSGFRSEMYQTDLGESFDIARQRMSPVINSDICADIGGDQQRILDTDTVYDNIKFKHILLPFWTAGFRFGKKSYQFIINGRTGEVQGDRPYSKWKIFFVALLAFIIMITLFSVFSSLQNPNQSSLPSLLNDLIYYTPDFNSGY